MLAGYRACAAAATASEEIAKAPEASQEVAEILDPEIASAPAALRAEPAAGGEHLLGLVVLLALLRV